MLANTIRDLKIKTFTAPEFQEKVAPRIGIKTEEEFIYLVTLLIYHKLVSADVKEDQSLIYTLTITKEHEKVILQTQLTESYKIRNTYDKKITLLRKQLALLG